MAWSVTRVRGATGAEELEPGGEAEVRRSPALAALLAGLVPGRRYRVLDLGTAVGANVAFFSRFSCHLRIADLHGSGWPGCAEGLEELLPAVDPAYDVILAWDLLNYFPRADLRRLLGRLGRIAAEGARLHCLVTASPEVPASPSAYKIEAPDRLCWEPRGEGTCRGSGCSPAEVEDLLGGFDLDRAVLLRNGFREYLAVRRR